MVRGGAIVMAVVAAALVLAGCTDDTTGSEETLTFTESNSGSHFATIGDATENHTPPGSGYTLSIPLQDSDGTVGEIDAICFATERGPQEPVLSGTCSGTADVPDGQLALNVGGEIDPNDSSGAIVGGTGKYEGAAGTFTSRFGGGETTDTFTITLP